MGEQEKKNSILIPILLVGIVLCLCVTVWALFFRQGEPDNLIPDYAPPEESNAQDIPNDTAEKLDNPENVEKSIVNTEIPVTITVNP